MGELTVRGALMVVVVWACIACDEESQSPAVDAAAHDAAADAAGPDGGVDATVRDAGTLDAQADAASMDAGSDATLHDAAVADADTGTTDDDSGVDAGPSVDCSAAVTCPNASAGKVTVCGRLYDVETDAQIRAGVPTALACGVGGEATDGPCELAIHFYDALDLAANPAAAAPIVPQNLQIDDCGRFVAEDIARPSLGFLAVLVDDASAAPDAHRATAAAFPTTSGERRDGERAYVVRKSTDAKWSSDVAFGASTFVDRGALMTIFYHGAAPITGVTVTSNGSARAADDYYFTDASAGTRYTVTATGPTQSNGTSLLLNSTLVEHSGQGSEPVGCVWPSKLGASVPGVLWVLPLVAELTGGGPCP